MSENHSISEGNPGGNVAGVSQQPEGLILRLKEFQDGAGRQIQEREIVFGETPEKFVRFVGVGHATVVMQTPDGERSVPEMFRFPVEGAEDIVHAFSVFDGYRDRGAALFQEKLQRRVAAAQKDAASPKLVLPGDTSLKGVPLPGGRPA